MSQTCCNEFYVIVMTFVKSQSQSFWFYSFLIESFQMTIELILYSEKKAIGVDEEFFFLLYPWSGELMEDFFILALLINWWKGDKPLSKKKKGKMVSGRYSETIMYLKLNKGKSFVSKDRDWNIITITSLLTDLICNKLIKGCNYSM